MSDRPLIIGHRGASALAPENTLAAFQLALSDGADGFEFDVRLTSDEVPVVIHDATLSRTGMLDQSVSELSAAEVSRINVGDWFNRKFPALARPEYANETVPSLKSVLESFSHTGTVLYLEMKYENSAWATLARRVVETIENYSVGTRTIVKCFHLPALEKVKSLQPNVRTAALFEPSIKHPLSYLKKLRMLKMAREVGADEISLHYSLVTPRIVAEAKQQNLPCVVWTVEGPDWLHRAKSLGLKALITNNPRVILQS